ncbi:hypothetical protein [Prevotella pallens]|uniref:hypothetical protein n=1 Tax=Prevotella pallens TaxID=60133 RepID=UPI0028D7BCFA|nr:hypothetical protein [Prevotella pallens]
MYLAAFIPQNVIYPKCIWQRTFRRRRGEFIVPVSTKLQENMLRGQVVSFSNNG